MQNIVISIRNTSLYGTLPSSADFACQRAALGPEWQDSIGPWPHLWFFVFKEATLAPELQVSTDPSPHLWFLHAKQDFWIWIINLCWSQSSPMVLCMQNNLISIRNTSLYGTLPSSAVFACQTAALGPEWQESMGPWPHLWFFVFKEATLEPELQVSIGPSPHLWLFHAKQDFWIWIINLYGSQTSPMVLWMQISVISNRNTSLHGSQTSSEVFQAKQRLLDQNYKSLWVPDLTCHFVHAKQRD